MDDAAVAIAPSTGAAAVKLSGKSLLRRIAFERDERGRYLCHVCGNWHRVGSARNPPLALLPPRPAWGYVFAPTLRLSLLAPIRELVEAQVEAVVKPAPKRKPLSPGAWMPYVRFAPALLEQSWESIVEAELGPTWT